MATNNSNIRIGIYGSDNTPAHERHGCGLWPAGYAAVLNAVGATAVPLGKLAGRSDALEDLHGVLVVGTDTASMRNLMEGQRLCEWCRKRRLPLLAVDHGLHLLNMTFGGTAYHDLPRERPEALQHRHPPERGLRHAIEIEPGTRLADLYGEGEVIVNSEHRRAVNRVARGFCVSGRALDGVIEAIEPEDDNWFALGVQWHPASATASGLDIQLFRGMVEGCAKRQYRAARAVCIPA
jgi:gamma-glutamyl-gamma-aminobutyrate hydrolase PuuD